MTPVDLAARRRLAKAAAILNDPTHPQHTLLVDLVDTALALDPPEGWEPEDDGDPLGYRQARGVVSLDEPAEVVIRRGRGEDPDPCPPSGIARPRRGGLIVRLPS